MALDFLFKDIIHRISVKFIHAFLPDAKKPYNLKAVHQPELDIKAIASKAEVYNLTTPSKVIEEGLMAGMELMFYLAADGYKIKTPLFNLRIKVPGEYTGSETSLPPGIHPEARLQTSAALRAYIREKVQIEFDGIDQSDGLIAEVIDEDSGQIDDGITRGKLITIHGYGLKIESDEAHADVVGLYFDDSETAPKKAQIIAVNEPRTLKVIVPPELEVGNHKRLRIRTQSSAKPHSGYLLKEVRQIVADFSLTVQ
jgi:hypothetical protein